MSRPSGVFKQDAAARQAWGAAYVAVPKSVFALVAYHLANVMSGSADTDNAAEREFIRELVALRDNGHLDRAQADRAIKAIQVELS